MDLIQQSTMAGLVLLLSSCATILNLVVGSPYPTRRKPQPSFLPTPNNITVHRGEVAVLGCHIYNLGPKMVVWRKDGDDVPLTIGKSTFSPEDQITVDVDEITENESRWDLWIKDVQSEHAGTYLCQVSASKLYTKYITLNVLKEAVKVKPFVSITGTEYVNQGAPIRLTCNATGGTRAPEEVDWFLNGNRIVTTQKQWFDRTTILKRKEGRSFISVLIIDRSSSDKDQGNYVCRSSDLSVNSIRVNVLSEDTEFERDVIIPLKSHQSLTDKQSSLPVKDNVSRRGSNDLPQEVNAQSHAISVEADLAVVFQVLVVTLYTIHR